MSELCLKGSGEIETPLLQSSKQNKSERFDVVSLIMFVLLIFFGICVVIFSTEPCDHLTDDQKDHRKTLVLISIVWFHNPVYLYCLRNSIKLQGGSKCVRKLKKIFFMYVVLIIIDSYLFVMYNCW